MPGLQVELGGDAVFLNAEDDTGHAGIGLLVALLVLVVVFGTIVAAVVPIGLAIVAVGAGIGAITLLAGTMDVSVSAIPIAGLVGLGVGIDYALFIVVRYRENRAAGQDDHRRARQTRWARRVRPSSSPVGPSSSRRRRSRSPASGVLTSIGLATALMVLFAVAAAITLLPALLGAAGRPDRQRSADPSSPHRRAPRGHRLVALRAPGVRTPVAVPARRRRRAARPRHAHAVAPDRLPGAGTPQPRPRTDRPTTCSPRVSAPGSTARCWSSSTWTLPASTPPTCRV